MPSEVCDSFKLHQQLESDCLQLGRFDLCRVLLMNDSRYPWCILVPERASVTETFQLDDRDQVQLMKESSCLAETMSNEFQADKMNVAVLGNIVSQLHVHHIVRYREDFAWPGPVWGKGDAASYIEGELDIMLERLQSCLASQCGLRPV